MLNQIALWKKIKTKNGANFPLNANSTKFDKQTEIASNLFFKDYKQNGFTTRNKAREIWSYNAGFYGKTFPSALVKSDNYNSYQISYKKGKEDAKKKFSSFGNFIENADNFTNNYIDNFS